MSEPEQWIEIVDWDRFQHYKNRNPPWIKNYLELLHNHNYLSLPPATQALLHKLWLLYASTRRTIPLDTRYVSRAVQQRVTNKQLESLNHAGFIRIVASKPLASRARSREVEKEKNVRTKDFERTLSRAIGSGYPQPDDDEELFEHDEEQEQRRGVGATEWPR